MNALAPIQGIPIAADRNGMREKMEASHRNRGPVVARIDHAVPWGNRSDRASNRQRTKNHRRAEELAKSRLRFGFLTADL